MAPPPVQSEEQLPDIGDPSDALMTPAAERRLGRAFLNDLKQRFQFIEEPVFEDYINDLGHRLSSKSHSSARRFRFSLIDSTTVNAFAGPDAQIGIFTGLILTTQSEDELASVMAHEIAHVTQKHLYRTFYRAQKMSTPAAVALLGAVLIGVAGGGEAGAAAVTGVQAGLMQDQLNYSRLNEQEADRVGMRLLYQSGFNPQAMPAFFANMAKANQGYSTQLPEFLRTHPVSTSRIADTQGRADKYPYKQRREGLRYHLLRAWLRVRGFRSAGQALTHYQGTLKTGRYQHRSVEEYGLALAWMRHRDYAKAIAILSRLANERPGIDEFRIALVQSQAQAGQAKAAMESVRAGLRHQPNSLPLLMARLGLFEAAGQYSAASKILKQLVEKDPQDERLFHRLSQAEGKLNHTAMAHGYRAEYHYLRGEFQAAVYQLEAALRYPLSDYQKAKFTARLRQCRQAFLEAKRNSKG